MCFTLISEQTAIISLCSINWLVFITETECLLRGSNWTLNIIQINFRRRLLTTEIRVRSQIIPCEICGGQSGKVTGFYSECFGFTQSLSFHQCSILIFTYMLLLSEGRAGEVWEPSRKQCCFGSLAAFDITVLPLPLSWMGQINE